MLILHRVGDDLYHASSTDRLRSPSEAKPEHLSNSILIPVAAFRPVFTLAFTRAPNALSPDVYVKKPRVLGYDRIRNSGQPNRIAEDGIAEVEVCELLRLYPYPNVATYLGCQVSDNRISSICFAKYKITLMNAFNPRSYMKRMSWSERQGRGDGYSRILEGIENGIRHLHSLGPVHNDINPSNIMLDKD